MSKLRGRWISGATQSRSTTAIMGLETRKGHSYYYRKVRDGRNVRSEYMGAGQLAQTIARIEQIEREERALTRETIKDDRAQFAELDAAIKLNDSTIKAALTELLEANGYHLHKRQWRKKRNNPPATNSKPSKKQ